MRIKKKIRPCLIFLAVAIFLSSSALPVLSLDADSIGSVAAETENRSPAESENQGGTHVIPDDKTGVRKKTELGILYDVSDGAATIYGYTGETAKLSVPAEIDGCPVTAIAETAFFGNTYLTSVTLPESIRIIGKEAFGSMSRLRTVTLPDGLKKIPQDCFRNCTILKSVRLPADLETIGENAFDGCLLLGTLELPESLSEIGEDAFRGCEQLTLKCGKNSYARQYAEAHAISTGFAGSSAALLCEIAGLTLLAAGILYLAGYLVRRHKKGSARGFSGGDRH